MNCLDFHRSQQADPQHLPAEACLHLKTCAACQAFAARMGQVETTLRETLDSVPIPDGLNERILLREEFAANRKWPHWSIAAGVILALSAALTLPMMRGDTSLARAALAHVEEEPDTLRARQQVSTQSIAEALATIGARLVGDIGDVTYLGTCVLPGGEGEHLVVSSPHGRYSLILMPRQAQSRNSAEQGLHAAIAKPAARGSYAIVASATPDIANIEKLLDQRVIWSQ